MKTIKIFIIIALLGAGGAQACDMTGAYILNLSQDERDKSSNCLRFDETSDQRACVKQALQANLSSECLLNLDIFVPGSNQEHGAWKQFNHMFNSDNNRGHISLRYEDTSNIDSADFDKAKYDQGVIDAYRSLVLLLDSVLTSSVRVFGHSKGSHAVALASERRRVVDFYAFAQAKRTAEDISIFESDIDEALLGTPGYIEKLSNNLIGITWENDEVQFMAGSGLISGFELPETWGFPGYVKDEGTDGTFTLNDFRIDHHNNYGGLWTDGLSSNDWRDGEGSPGPGYPYCATGNKRAYDRDECEKRTVSFAPWFWGHQPCRKLAFGMMDGAAVGTRYRIGNSGPREPNSCRESKYLIPAVATLRYRWSLPDKDCINRMRVEFRGLQDSSRVWGSFEVEGTTENENEWITDTFDVNVPPHMNLALDMRLSEVNDGGTCNAFLANQTELWIEELSLRFQHPGVNQQESVTILGYREGSDAAGTLDKSTNTPWEQPDRENEEYRIRYSTFYDSIKIEVDAESPKTGFFIKPVYLLD